MPKTGIVCTIGPSSNNEKTLREMRTAGMDAARLNFSHGSHETHLGTIGLIKKLNRRGKNPLMILQDLEGYRIRIGVLGEKGEMELKKGERVFLSNCPRKSACRGVIPFDYEGPLDEIGMGSSIYIDDGSINLKVLGPGKERIEAEVLVPGILKANKGVNIPGVRLKFKGIKDKDKRDIHFGLEHGVDFIAQSFVRKKDDIIAVNDLINEKSGRCGVIAKIECRQGIDNIDEIIDVSDGIMIARGDMGVSIPVYQIPIVQKMIIRKCNGKKKFVITATQMLESMTYYTAPTRAEVSDVSNAVIDGADYLMLSGETAVGRDPAGTVGMMRKIIGFTEKNLPSLQ